MNLKQSEIKPLPKPIEPLVVTTVFDEDGDVERYKGIAVEELLKRPIEETVWLLWTGNKPSKLQAELTRKIIIILADHGPEVAGAYATILATSAGISLPQAVAAGVSMIGPRFGGAAGLAAECLKHAVDSDLTVEAFEQWMKEVKLMHLYPGIGHKIYSKSRPDRRVAGLVLFAKKNIKKTPHLNFALSLEDHLFKKNEKLILNIDGAIGAILMDVGFPPVGVDGFFVLSRTIGLVAHFIDQRERGTGLIRLPSVLVLNKNEKSS